MPRYMTRRLAMMAVGALIGSSCSSATISTPSIKQPSEQAPSLPISAAPSISNVPDTPSPAPSVSATPLPVSASPSGPLYMATGTATVTLSVGSEKETFTAPLWVHVNDGYVLPDGSLSAQWINFASNGNIIQGLDVNIPRGESGTYEIDNTVKDDRLPYAAFFAKILGSSVERVTCDVSVERTPTGGISGTIDCEGRLVDLHDPMTAKGTFAAEP